MYPLRNLSTRKKNRDRSFQQLPGLMLLVSFIFIFSCPEGRAQELPLLQVTRNGHYLETMEGKPFFWLGDTAWELLHRGNKEEIRFYLEDRAEKGFTVIQTVILAELDGLNTPNALGDLPLIDNDPSRLNEAYFRLVDYTIELAEELGLYVGLLPTWGDKFSKLWETGPEVFTPKNALQYGKLLGERYREHNNIIWILGGDRIPEKKVHFEVIEAMAEGILKKDNRHLITYHPWVTHRARSYFDAEWLQLDMYQSGHERNAKEYVYPLESRAMLPAKPVINGEARYENIREHFWKENPGPWLDQADVRISAYWSMLAGAAGYSYGCNDVWQLYDEHKEPSIMARTGWKTALDLPGAVQMGYMRAFFETLPWQSLVPDQSLILSDNPEGPAHCRAARLEDDGSILVYVPRGTPVKVDLSGIPGKAKASWFNPRSGLSHPIGIVAGGKSREFKPWASGRGSDFLLVLDLE